MARVSVLDQKRWTEKESTDTKNHTLPVTESEIILGLNLNDVMQTDTSTCNLHDWLKHFFSKVPGANKRGRSSREHAEVNAPAKPDPGQEAEVPF
jgi:hypothetical protein